MAEPTPADRLVQARADLAAALDALDDKLNLPKRARATTERIKASYRSNRLPWIAGGVGAAVLLVGAIAVAIARRSR